MTQKPLKICNTCQRVFQNPTDFLQNTRRWRVCSRGHLWFNCACDSTSMIRKGQFPWYSPDNAMSKQASSIFNRIPNLKELPHLPTYVMELQTLLQDENTTSIQLAEVTKKAPLLAGKVLDIANKQGQIPGQRIESLAHAISFIGRTMMRDIVMVAGVQEFECPTQVMSREQFWEDSFLVGRIAELLSKRYPCNLLADEAYVAGTLCNVGKLVLAITLPDQADQITSDCQNLSILGNWQQAEQRHGFPQHTVLGEIGAVFWGLPEYVLNSSAFHHSPPTGRDKDGRFRGYNVVALANQIGHWVQLRPTEIDEIHFNKLCRYFGLNRPEAEKLAEEFLHLRTAS